MKITITQCSWNKTNWFRKLKLKFIYSLLEWNIIIKPCDDEKI